MPQLTALSLFAPAEFVLTVASEANEICEKDSKKTMLPDHVVNALKVRPLVALSEFSRSAGGS